MEREHFFFNVLYKKFAIDPYRKETAMKAEGTTEGVKELQSIDPLPEAVQVYNKLAYIQKYHRMKYITPVQQKVMDDDEEV